MSVPVSLRWRQFGASFDLEAWIPTRAHKCGEDLGEPGDVDGFIAKEARRLLPRLTSVQSEQLDTFRRSAEFSPASHRTDAAATRISGAKWRSRNRHPPEDPG